MAINEYNCQSIPQKELDEPESTVKYYIRYIASQKGGNNGKVEKQLARCIELE